MKRNTRTKEQLLAENEDLRRRLEEAEETLRAIHEGEVDALVLSKPEGEVVFTLKGAESPYRVFVEAMNEGAVTLDPEGTILFCNNRFAGMLKLPADKVIGSSIRQFIPSTDISGFESALQGGHQRDTTVDISLQREDHGLIPVHLSFNMLYGQDKPVLYMVAMDLTEHKRLEETLRQFNAQLEKRVEDRTAELLKTNETLWAEITERKRAEEALAESERRYRGIVETAEEGIATHMPDGTITYVNQRMADMLGYAREEIIGRSSLEFVDDEEREAVIRARKSLKEQGSFSNERKMRRKDGSVLWTLSNVSPQRDRAGNFVGYLGMHTDITERKRAEEAVRKTHEELEKKVQERTSDLSDAVERLRAENTQRKQLEETLRESEAQVRFFASQCLTAQETERKRIAGELHDSIAASLGAIKFSIEKILCQKGQNERTQAELKDLISKVQLATEETRRIMADLRPSLLDDLGIVPAINWFCREFEKTYSHIRVEKEIDLSENELTDSLKTAIFRISQEAMNNIAKHSKATVIDLGLRNGNRGIELTIRDNGQGFDVGTVKRGLGLSTMRERTELSGGVFSVESVQGTGTTIRCLWPP